MVTKPPGALRNVVKTLLYTRHRVPKLQGLTTVESDIFVYDGGGDVWPIARRLGGGEWSSTARAPAVGSGEVQATRCRTSERERIEEKR